MARDQIMLGPLARQTGIDVDVLRGLRDNNWVSIKHRALERLLNVFRVPLHEFFVSFDDDVWGPIRTGREVTIHFGSSSLREVVQDRSTRVPAALRESIGYWDLCAFFVIGAYVSQLGGVATLQFRAHPTDVRDESAVREVFREGNHIIIGSPIANAVAEGVVSGAFGVPPNSSEVRSVFPYTFVWDRRVKGVSSFGITARGENQMGILATKSGKRVAQRTLVEHGSRVPGKDCALIVTHRLEDAAAPKGDGRRHAKGRGEDDATRIIIAILGHSGPGTLAGAETIVDEANRGELYPAIANQPRMRVVGAHYVRREPGPRDSRVLTDRWLEPEEA